MDWIQAIKEDDNKALRQLYSESREPCIAWLIKNYKISRDDATEIFQISVVILYENICSGKLLKLNSSVSTYLHAIAKNKVFELRRRYVKVEHRDNTNFIFSQYLVDESGVEDKNRLESKIAICNKYLSQIGDPCKSLLQLYYFAKKSMTEITTELGYKNANTTKNQKYKCLKRLQSMANTHKEQIG